MVLMLPVMFMASKLNWDDAGLVFKVRISYYSEQALLLLMCALLLLKVTGPAKTQLTKIWVKNPPSFAEPEPKWASTTYRTYELSALQQLASQILMGVIMTSFLHFKMNIKQSMIMQACMIPLTFIDAPIVKRHLFNSTERVYDEKLEGEARDAGAKTADAAADATANATDEASADATADPEKLQENGASFAEVSRAGSEEAAMAEDLPRDLGQEAGRVAALIRQTWDQGRDAEYEPLVGALTPALVNTADDNEATALMIIAAGVCDVSKYVQQVLALGADPKLTDDEGWTALHWATFHTSVSGVRTLCEFGDGTKALLEVTDDSGETALDLGRKELASSKKDLRELENDKNEEEADGDEADPLTLDSVKQKKEEVRKKTEIVAILAKSLPPADDMQEID